MSMLQVGCYELLQFIGWSKLAKYVRLIPK